MGDDAVIRLGYDNAKVRAGAKETEAIMNRASGKIRTDWNQTSKDLKDAFEPMSRGALVKVGGMGAALYGVQMAVGAVIDTVDRLSKAEYISSQQQAQMKYISDFFTDISQERDRWLASGVTMIGDALTGGAVSAGGAMEEQASARERTVRLEIQLGAITKQRMEAEMTLEEKLAALQKRRDDLELSINNRKKTPTNDERLKKEIERQNVLKQIDEVERARDQRNDARASQIQDAQQNYESRVVQNALEPQGKLVQLVAQQKELEQRIADAGDDELKKLQLRAQLEDVNAGIKREQLGIYKQSEDLAKKEVERLKKISDFETSNDILQAKAHGRKREASRLEREQQVSKKAEEIQAMGFSPEEARAKAEDLQKLQDRAAKKAGKGGRSTISGYSRSQYEKNPFVDHRSFSEFFGSHMAAPTASDEFNNFFHRGANRMSPPPTGTARRGFGTHSNTTKSGDDATRLLQRIAQGVDLLGR